MKDEYADVIVDISQEKLDRAFQYRIPRRLQGQICEGMRVLVPFGGGNRRVEGYVIGMGSQAKYDPSKTKEIIEIPQGSIPVEARLIALAAWIRKTYGSTMIQALKTVLPVKEQKKARVKKKICLNIEEAGARAWLEEFRRRHYKAKQRLLEALLQTPELEDSYVRKELKITGDTLKVMETQGILRVEQERIYRNPVPWEEEEKGAKGGAWEGEEASLNLAQKEVVEGLREEWDSGPGRPCLLQGVTGSGKTMVYIELIRRCLKKGGQAILLIPEIALTWQTVQRFHRSFGNQVTVLHSRLTPAERYDQFERARRGEVQIVIGPRSALFTPFPNLKLIVIDEEHETSYRSEVTPRYHARETAEERARLEGAHLLMGSATPSVDAFWRCKRGDYALFRLEGRYGGAEMPRVAALDMREELKAGNRTMLSRRLQEAMQIRLEAGEQTMLFLNRRGYAGFVSCRSCGYVVKCPHCDVSLTYHKGGRLVCHYCGFERDQIQNCPECGSPYIGGFRAGTQQVEQVVRKMFPRARTLRMDADTTKGKEGHEQILRSFSGGEADVLIGTQMIVKGHDFPRVTLVGVLAADVSLYASDYRAAERTYQLLVQASGRAGRGRLAGEALIQTYHPEHYSIRAALDQDYDSFYREEISHRQILGYPPVANLLAVHGSCPEEETLANAMEFIRRYLIRWQGSREMQLIGPAPETVARIQDSYRQVLYVKCPCPEELIRIRTQLERYIDINRGFDPIQIQYDFN